MAKFSRFTLLLLLPYLLTVSAATTDDLVIDTRHGRVQGKSLSVLGGNIRAFLGIPYGKPPVGKLRFSPPEPVESWEGVRDATQFPNSCYQLPDTTFQGRIHIYMDGHNVYICSLLCCVHVLQVIQVG